MWMPTRVIDVGIASGPFVRLLETNGLRCPYLTLSHCWGKSPPSRTTSSNSESHKARIDLKNLNRNFQDAILMTRRLNFRYIWIDALCIVQDSVTDWEQEAPTMGLVYKRCALTIAPCSAASHDEGFLNPRPPPSQTEHNVELPYNDRSGKVNGTYFLSNRKPQEFEKEVSEGPLNTCGWTLQERIQSPRTIYFGRDQLHFECATT